MELSKEEIYFFLNNSFFETPKSLQIEINNVCPLNCPQCYKDPKEYGQMEWGVFVKKIDEASKLGIKGISILGGEPLVHKDICRMIDYACSKGIKTAIYSSGVQLETSISTIKSYEGSAILILSLNGSTKEINGLSRDGYDVTKKAMETCRLLGLKYGINWVARHDNINDFENLVKLGKHMNASFINIVCNKIGKSGHVDSPISKEDFQYLIELYKTYKNEISLSIQTCYGPLISRVFQFTKARTFGCQAGVSVCGITYKGDYTPCLHLYYPEKYSSIVEFWDKSKLLKELRKNERYEEGYCSNCKMKSDCHFCRASSDNTYKDFKAHLDNCVAKVEL